MQKTQMIIQEMEKLVGSDVVIFGQVKKIQEPSPFHVRITEVLKELQPHEATDLTVSVYDEELDDFVESEAESIDAYLDYLDALLCLKEVSVNNSYNWNAPIDHHFNYVIYHDQLNDRYIVEFSVHRYGDVRANYTDSVLYSFDHIDDFFSAVAQAGYYKKLGKYYLEACPLQEGWRIYNEEGDLLEELYDEQDILEFVNS